MFLPVAPSFILPPPVVTTSRITARAYLSGCTHTQVLLDTQHSMLNAGVPKRMKSENDVAVPFYYSGERISIGLITVSCMEVASFLIRIFYSELRTPNFQLRTPNSQLPTPNSVVGGSADGQGIVPWNEVEKRAMWPSEGLTWLAGELAKSKADLAEARSRKRARTTQT